MSVRSFALLISLFIMPFSAQARLSGSLIDCPGNGLRDEKESLLSYDDCVQELLNLRLAKHAHEIRQDSAVLEVINLNYAWTAGSNYNPFTPGSIYEFTAVNKNFPDDVYGGFFMVGLSTMKANGKTIYKCRTMDAETYTSQITLQVLNVKLDATTATRLSFIKSGTKSCDVTQFRKSNLLPNKGF